MNAGRVPSKQKMLAAALRKLLADPTAREQAERALRIFDADMMTATALREENTGQRLPIVIGEHRFATRAAAFHVALRAGFNGTQSTFYLRLKNGATWEEAIAPVDVARSQSRKTGHQNRKAQMSTALATMAPPLAHLRHERALDGAPGRFDVVAYNPEGKALARWAWHLSTCPKARNKECTINGNTYRIHWDTAL